ncbi:sensor histidine kinase [Kribbella monticola]|uniref:sensor histidine kinase n=1 Tax=Kribbella monticola TaxID=2185285 RepID=UPI000DD32911|nr:sensor domain-containing protein [Kribbella monticola]
MATSVASPVPRAPWRLWRSPYLWLATVHLLGDAVAVLVVGLLVLLMLIVAVLALPLAYLGIPLTVGATRLVYAAGGWERARAAITRDQVIPPLMPPARTGSAAKDARAALADRALWRQFGYFVLLFGMACVGVPAIVLAWSVPPVLIALPFYYSGWAAGRSQLGPFEIDSVTKAGVVGALALLFLLFVSPLLIRGLSAADGVLARNLLGASATGALVKRVDQLVESRQQVVDSVEAERRRMERDLHDGAQQRLVSLAMTLGRARSRLGTSNPGVLELIEQAHAEAMQAITELRDLTRGLHPPVLTDRGLDAAISAVAARAPFPVRVDIRVPVRPSLTIESIVYFVVTESLTNIAKHAQAARAAIQIIRVGDRLRLVVTDDGRGGADPDRGTGLQGLIDRVSGVDGDFSVVSPIGGPTVVTVEVPCG